MAGTCTFNVGQVRRLFEHSKNSQEHSPGWDHIFDGQYYPGGKPLDKEGKPIKGDDWPDGSKIDNKLIPACLDFVGDHGIYLMSNGMPGQLVEEGKPNRVVAYAAEADPTSKDDDWYDNKVAIFGGDDGSHSLPLSMFERVMELPDDATFKIKLTSRNIQVVVPSAPKKRVTLKAGMRVRFKNPVKFQSGTEHAFFQIVDVKTGRCMALADDGKVLPKFYGLDTAGMRECIRAGAAEIVE